MKKILLLTVAAALATPAFASYPATQVRQFGNNESQLVGLCDLEAPRWPHSWRPCFWS